jgi:hypothetical protein
MRSKDKEYRQRNHRPSYQRENPVEEHRDIIHETQKPALGETQGQEGRMNRIGPHIPSLARARVVVVNRQSCRFQPLLNAT